MRQDNSNSITYVAITAIIVLLLGLSVIYVPGLLKQGALWGAVVIDSNPRGATVTISDGQTLSNVTPVTYYATGDLDGKTLTFTKAGYYPKTFLVFQGVSSPIGVTLVQIADGKYNVLVQSYPSGATVTENNGVKLGTTPFSLAMNYAEIKYVTFSKPDYVSKAWQIRWDQASVYPNLVPIVQSTPGGTPQPTVPGGQQYTVTIDSIPTNAALSIAGEYKGQTPYVLKLNSGESQTISLYVYGYKTAYRNINYNSVDLDVELIQDATPDTTDAPTPTPGVSDTPSGTPTPGVSNTPAATGTGTPGTTLPPDTKGDTGGSNTIYYVIAGVIVLAAVYYLTLPNNEGKGRKGSR